MEEKNKGINGQGRSMKKRQKGARRTKMKENPTIKRNKLPGERGNKKHMMKGVCAKKKEKKRNGNKNVLSKMRKRECQRLIKEREMKGFDQKSFGGESKNESCFEGSNDQNAFTEPKINRNGAEIMQEVYKQVEQSSDNRCVLWRTARVLVFKSSFK